MLVVQFHPEHRTRQNRVDASFHFNRFLFHIFANKNGGIQV